MTFGLFYVWNIAPLLRSNEPANASLCGLNISTEA
jgi:hypothetical protein